MKGVPYLRSLFLKEGEGGRKEGKKASFAEREALQRMILTSLVDKANSAFQGRCFVFVSSKEVGLAMNLPLSYIITSEVFDHFFLN